MACLLRFPAKQLFPLIQLPKKLEAAPGAGGTQRTRVSINSTSEEVRRRTYSWGPCVSQQFPLIQLPKKLEENKSVAKVLLDRLFPLIQLPKKLEAETTTVTPGMRKHVSINSTSEEVRSGGFQLPPAPDARFH